MSKRSVAYYVVATGGTGRAAVPITIVLHQRLGRPFQLRSHAIDSDHFDEHTSLFDATTYIGLEPDEVDTMRANISKYGPEAEVISEHFAEYLHREKVSAGSRARPPLTQFFAAFHRDKLIADMRRQVMQLMCDQDINQIQPLIVTSSGGGCGNPLSQELALLMDHPTSRGRILAGFSNAILRRPILFAIDPYAKADRNNEIQQMLIYSNAMAFACKSDFCKTKTLLRRPISPGCPIQTVSS